MTLNANFMIPYQRNANFMGRIDVLSRIRTKLCDVVPNSWNHRVALHGLGGVGKTQLTLEYVYKSKEDYERIYWINAASKESLIAGFQGIAGRTKCVPKNLHLTPEDTAKYVLEWLNTQSSCLLVLDNLENAEDIDGYLPTESPGRHTLITTRNPYSYQIPAEGIKIEVFDAEEAVELLVLRSRIRPSNETAAARLEAAEIVKELGYLPLAIEQAAAYIREVLRDLSKFLPLYTKDRKKQLGLASKANRNYYTETVETTWRMSLTRIEENNPDAPLLLQLLSFLNPDAILTDFLEEGADGLPDSLNRIIANESRFYEALSELERFSLIGRQRDYASGERLTVHRLVQTVVKDDMPPQLLLTLAEAVLGLCECAFPDFDYETDSELRFWCRRVVQDQVVTPLSSWTHTNSIRLGYLLSLAGSFLGCEGNDQQASELLARSVEILKTSQGAECSRAMAGLAAVYRCDGRLSEAATLNEKSLQIMKRLHGDESWETSIAMRDVAYTYQEQGRMEDALEIYWAALDIQQRVRPESHGINLGTIERVACIYENLGRAAHALELRERAFIFNAISIPEGMEDTETLALISSLVPAYIKNGRFEEALQLAKQSFNVCERIFGREHPVFLAEAGSMARTIIALRLPDEFITFMDNVFGKLTKHWGFDLVWKSVIDLISHEFGKVVKLGDAVRLCEKILNARRCILGNEHPEIWASMAFLSTLLYANGKFEESVSLSEECFEAMHNVFGNDDPVWTSEATEEVPMGCYLRGGTFCHSLILLRKVIERRGRTNAVNPLNRLHRTQAGKT
jgi:tetratricopeptide (TPR) repeat protein